MRHNMTWSKTFFVKNYIMNELLEELNKDFCIQGSFDEVEKELAQRLNGQSKFPGKFLEIHLFYLVSKDTEITMNYIGVTNDLIQYYYQKNASIILNLRELPMKLDFDIMLKMMVNIKLNDKK